MSNMDTTTDRETIPSLDEDELIQVSTTDLAKIGASVAAVIAVIGAAALTAVGLDKVPDDVSKGLVVLGAAIILAFGLLAWGMVAAADVQARGTVTSANLALRATAAHHVRDYTGGRSRRHGRAMGHDKQWRRGSVPRRRIAPSVQQRWSHRVPPRPQQGDSGMGSDR